jgi:two-component SAPR family response regulator
LGGFSVSVNDIPVLRWRAGKARSLFQFLLIHRGRLVPGERLREVLWPMSGFTPQSSSLKVAMHAVRKTLAEYPCGGEAMRIASEGGGYILTTAGVWIDVEEMEGCASEARAAEQARDWVGAGDRHRRVVGLYQGDFLAGEYAGWVVEQREWCKATVLHSLRWLRGKALRDNDYLGAIGMCRRILEIDPYVEEAYQTLMVVHARLGELGRVRSWYDLCTRRLREELDVVPAKQTERILIGAMRGEYRAIARSA